MVRGLILHHCKLALCGKLHRLKWIAYNLFSADTPFSQVKLGDMTKYLARRDYNPIALFRCVTRGMSVTGVVCFRRVLCV